MDIWVNQLASIGCSVQAFLQVYSTAFYYLSAIPYSPADRRRLLRSDYLETFSLATTSTEAVPIVSWTSSSQVNEEVFYWYQNLQACYTEVFDIISSENAAANGFFREIDRCYGRVAYIYRSETSVYNVSFDAVTADDDSWMIRQCIGHPHRRTEQWYYDRGYAYLKQIHLHPSWCGFRQWHRIDRRGLCSRSCDHLLDSRGHLLLPQEIYC